MDATAFNGLKVGNVVKDGTDDLFVVTVVLTNRDGSTHHVAIQPAIDADDALSFDLVSPDYTACCGQTINPE